ncbi:MAG: tetratricopeptide repeat protein [Gammaproteobacteria bacterium]|nr:tetratricopeptide repeat protein [Gammaproteobacteria bacterium]
MHQSADPRATRVPILCTALFALLGGCTTTPAPVTEVPVDEPGMEEEAGESATPLQEPPLQEPPLEEARTYALPEEAPPAVGAGPDGMNAGNAAPAPTTPGSGSEMNSPAVVALLDEAEVYASQGDGDQAAATIERALRIEPKNPWLWHRLAVIRMQQGRYSEAIELAARSSSLAGGDARLLQGNQQVIERSRAAMSDAPQG